MGNLRRSMIDVHRVFFSLRLSSSSNIRAPASATFAEPYVYSSSFQRLLRFSTETLKGTDSENVDFSNEESKRRLVNRLLYRSRQRGYLELDLVLGNWVEKHIHSMDEEGIKALVEVLNMENPDLWKWLTSQDSPPETLLGNPVFKAIQEKLTANLNKYSSPETRAIPGEPWIRGWDDIKKLPGSPVAGNQ